ncbi:MAG: hypothetical protein JNL32_15090 [Candidatus Kapabacteria bacterium]|nr:hypothetical protein [Candidatus Kapabacteria bacterium]
MQENLQKIKRTVPLANFVTAALMLGGYFLLPPEIEYRLWFLVATVAFVIAGVGMIVFVNKLQKKYSNF